MPKYTCPKCSTQFSVDESSDSDDFDDTFGKEVTIIEDITDKSSVRPKHQESVTKEKWIFGDDYIIANITGYWGKIRGGEKDMRKFKLKDDYNNEMYFCRVYPDKEQLSKSYSLRENDYWLYFIEKEDDNHYYMYNERIANADPKILKSNNYDGYELFKEIQIDN